MGYLCAAVLMLGLMVAIYKMARPASSKLPVTSPVSDEAEISAQVRHARLSQEKDDDPAFSKRAVAFRLSSEAADLVRIGQRSAVVGKLDKLHRVLEELAAIQENHGEGMERQPVMDALLTDGTFADIACSELLQWYSTTNVANDLVREDLFSYLGRNSLRGGNLRSLAQYSIEFLQTGQSPADGLRGRVRENLDHLMAVVPEYFLNQDQVDGYSKIRCGDSKMG